MEGNKPTNDVVAQEIPPVTLWFGFYEGISGSKAARARENFRDEIMRHNPGLSIRKAGVIGGLLVRGFSYGANGRLVDIPVAFTYESGYKGLTFCGGDREELQEYLEEMVNPEISTAIANLFEGITSEEYLADKPE